MDRKKQTVFITGVTGVMGMAGLKELLGRTDRFDLVVLVRPSNANRKKMAFVEEHPGVRIVWGDLTCYDDVYRGVCGADVVLHVGAMVSPKADYYPEETWRVNVGGTENVVRAVLAQSNVDQIKLVYIGSVSQTSDRHEPIHWGRTGDPICISAFDHYALSKTVAERIVVESGIRHWVSLRQSGILYADIFRNYDPILFHVPLRGVMEWATIEDSGRVLANVCEEWLAEGFWNRFYHIGSGKSYRLTNYRFEQLLLATIGAPRVEKIFNPEWFALRNFHGLWFADSDLLESYLHFRENVSVEVYFERLKRNVPWYYSLVKWVPAFLIKWMGMYPLACHKQAGTLGWIRSDNNEKIEAFFGSKETWEQIPSWGEFDTSLPSEKVIELNHGYDETKPTSELTIEDMREAAQFRGGKCVSETMRKGDLGSKLSWECSFGHRFEASPALILLGGHWCSECMPPPWNYDRIARTNPFFAQVWTYARASSEHHS